MIKNFFYRLSLAIIFITLLPLNAFAFNVEVTPEEVVPGDVFLLKIHEAGSTSSAEAEFRGEKIKFYPATDNLLIALVPVDINTMPKKHDILIRHGIQQKVASINVKSHTFKTIKLALPEEKVTLSPENQKRAAREAALLNSIWVKDTFKLWDGRFINPTDTEISEVFGVKRIINKKKNSVHKGMDFRGETGTPIRAINSGIVVLNGDLFFGGKTLIIDHGMGLYSIYMHLSKFNVLKGEKVLKEQVIGFIGSSGRATGPHLHLSVKLNGVSVNPESLFKLKL